MRVSGGARERSERAEERYAAYRDGRRDAQHYFFQGLGVKME